MFDLATALIRDAVEWSQLARAQHETIGILALPERPSSPRPPSRTRPNRPSASVQSETAIGRAATRRQYPAALIRRPAASTTLDWVVRMRGREMIRTTDSPGSNPY